MHVTSQHLLLLYLGMDPPSYLTPGTCSSLWYWGTIIGRLRVSIRSCEANCTNQPLDQRETRRWSSWGELITLNASAYVMYIQACIIMHLGPHCVSITRGPFKGISRVTYKVVSPVASNHYSFVCVRRRLQRRAISSISFAGQFGCKNCLKF